MGLEYNESKKQWEWEGSVQGLVSAVGNGDARLGFVVDKKSGAKVAMNINGTDDEMATEPFYIESPDGDNLYDASNRREAVSILVGIRRGDEYPDMQQYDKPKSKTKKAKAKPKRKTDNLTTLRGIRR